MNSPMKLKLKTPIFILTLVALIFRVILSIDSFLFYPFDFGSPNVWILIYSIFALAPIVLFLIYILKFHQKLTASILVPIVFGLIAIESIFILIIDSILYGFDFTSLAFSSLVFIIPFVLATICALNGLTKKTLIIVAFSVVFLPCSIEMFELLRNIPYYFEGNFNFYYNNPIVNLCETLGPIAFYVSLFLFAMKNRIPSILVLSPKQEKKREATLSPEQALILLKDKRDFGIITEEEYQAQRAEIISKL